MMSEPKPFSETEFEDARKRSASGAWVMFVLAAFIALQFILTITGVMNEGLASADKSFIQIYLGVYVVVAIILGVLIQVMRSRIALVLSLLMFFMNWWDYIVLMQETGEFQSPGWVNLIGPFIIAWSLYQAFVYHRLKKRRPPEVDPNVFA